MTTVFLICCILICTLLALTSASIDEMIMDSFEDPAAADQAMFDLHQDMDHGGKMVVRHEYDMMLMEDQYTEIMNGDDSSGRKKRKATKSSRSRWENNVVPYSINDNAFSGQDKEVIEEAIKHWSDLTCIQFRKKTNSDKNFVYFDNGNGCYSYVGMVGGSQTIGLARGCRHKGVIAHEIGHAIGFHHEQNRPDRDSYITIHKQNIPDSLYHNFRKYPYSEIETEVPYDYGSVMHYGGKAFSTNGMFTIRTKNARDQNKIGNREGLSFHDVWLANVIYKCDAGCGSKKCKKNQYLGKGCKCYCKSNDRQNPVEVCGGGSSTKKPTTKKPSVTVKPPVEECSDMHRHCEYWAGLSSKNYCRSNNFVKANCKKACGKCGTVMNCMDMSTFCSSWQEKGYCEGRWARYVGELCPHSCTGCQFSEEVVGDSSSGGGGGRRGSPFELVSVLMVTIVTAVQVVVLL